MDRRLHARLLASVIDSSFVHRDSVRRVGISKIVSFILGFVLGCVLTSLVTT